ncbi:hypothetical protein ACFFK0_04490 [Paenibacillus chartarius]|uniref:Uncharacterized protein n=1 Tax=Paenibacillus chartarius TaxID=747481 RepID=A0ABV6DGF5_9BACL
METVLYIRQPEVHVRGTCCVHLDEATVLTEDREADADVWLESFVPERTLAAARRLRRPVLNSLWLEERYWQAYEAALGEGLFRSIVLVPYEPGADRQDYDRNVERLFAYAERYGLGREACIVDLALLPHRKLPVLDEYRRRLARLSEMNLRSVAAFDNYIHGADDKRDKLRQLKDALGGGGLKYALIRAKYAGVLE